MPRNFNISNIFITIVAIMIGFTVHEFSHAIVAYKLGDTSTKHDGRITLNPMAHIDIMGFICLLFLGYGWAKPVMVDSSKFENTKIDMAYVALAGPLSNVLLAIISQIIFTIIYYFFSNADFIGFLFMFQSTFFHINIVLAVFNLLPIPPLDGSKFFGAILPDNLYFPYIHFDRGGTILLLILVVTGATYHITHPIVIWLSDFIILLVEKICFFV